MEKHRDMAAKGKGNGHQHRRYPAEHVLRKIHHCTFGRKISGRPFFRILPPKFYILSLKNSDDLFFFF